MSYVSNLCRERALQRPVAQKAPQAPIARHDRPAVALDELQGMHVGEKVLREHAASFKPAVADMEALAERVSAMDPHRAKQVGRALEAFYAKVGSTISKVAIGDRAAAVETAVQEARALVDHIAHDELVGPAIAAMADLLGYGQSAPRAREALTGLLDRIDGRAGATSALNVYPNVVWHVDHRSPLAAPQQRFERWSGIAQVIADALPRTRFDQSDVTTLASLVTEELEKNPRDALERAKARMHQAIEPAYAEARAKAAVMPPGLQAGAHSGLSFEVISKAVLAAIDANPAGPTTLAKSFETLLAVVTQQARAADIHRYAGWEAIAALLRQAAETPSIEAITNYFAAKAPHLVGNAGARAELARAAGNAAETASAVLRAEVMLRGFDPNRADLRDALAQITALPGASALSTAVALAQKIAAGDPGVLLPAVAQFAAKSPTADVRVIEAFIDRFLIAYPEVAARVGAPQAMPVASAVARANLAAPMQRAQAQQIGEVCRQMMRAAPATPFAALIADDADKRPGIITLSNTEGLRWNPPVYYLSQLLPHLNQVQLSEAARLTLTRHAMHLSREIAKLDRDPNTIWNHVLRDWRTALQQPNAIHFAMRAGNVIDVRMNNGVAGESAPVRFLREHAELPPELAFTAAVQLSSEQVGWLKSFIGSERSRMQIRNVRDSVYACVDSARLDLLDALQKTQASRGIIARICTFVAAEYRGGRARQVPFDQLIAGLRKGEDPLPEIERARLGGGNAAPGAVDAGQVMDLMGMGKVKADAETIASIKRALPDLQALLGGLPVGGQIQGTPAAVYRDPILACLQSMVDGTWPAVKYDNDAGRRALEGLTPEQRAIWMEEWVTPKDENVKAVRVAQPAKPEGEIADALTLLRGLIKALPLEVRLGEGLAFDRASADRLRGELDDIRAQLHKSQKGTDAHRALSTQAGPIGASLAVIELALALQEQLGPGASAKTILELQPLLESAAAATRKLGARGCYEALTRVLQAAPEPAALQKKSPRQGIHAADEDSLEAWVTSFDAGCISSKNGQNRMSQAELISGAQYRMLRVCNDKLGVTRSMYRLHKVSMPGYEGHAIWMDSPMLVSRGQQPTPDMYLLAYKHGLKKAMAMGVPFMFNNGQGTQAAQQLGLPVQQVAVKMSIDRGNTGLHHSQGISGAPYFVAWPANQGCGYRNATDDKTYYEQNYNFSVVMPPK